MKSNPVIVTPLAVQEKPCETITPLHAAIAQLLSERDARQSLLSAGDLIVLLRARSVSLPENVSDAWELVSTIRCDLDRGITR